jgi:hypothetical protein
VPVPAPVPHPVPAPSHAPVPAPKCPHISEIKECYLNDYYLTFKFKEKGHCKQIKDVDIHVKSLMGNKEFSYNSNDGHYDDEKCEVRRPLVGGERAPILDLVRRHGFRPFLFSNAVLSLSP